MVQSAERGFSARGNRVFAAGKDGWVRGRRSSRRSPLPRSENSDMYPEDMNSFSSRSVCSIHQFRLSLTLTAPVSQFKTLTGILKLFPRLVTIQIEIGHRFIRLMMSFSEEQNNPIRQSSSWLSALWPRLCITAGGECATECAVRFPFSRVNAIRVNMGWADWQYSRSSTKSDFVWPQLRARDTVATVGSCGIE